MDRAASIEQFAASRKPVDIRDFVNAMVRCLNPDETVNLLLNTAATSSPARAPALRKVCGDIADGAIADPAPLITILIDRVGSAAPRRRQSVAFCLLEVARACSTALRCQAQAFFGSSRYVGLRRRSYALYNPDHDPSRQLLEQCWLEHRDVQAAWLIVKTFPPAFLVDEKAELLESLAEGWQLARFYLRIAESQPTAFEELLARDPISYLYVAAKRRVPPPLDIVEMIARENLSDDRYGLLLWSLGELGFWDVLVGLSQDIDAIHDARRALVLRRLADE